MSIQVYCLLSVGVQCAASAANLGLPAASQNTPLAIKQRWIAMQVGVVLRWVLFIHY